MVTALAAALTALAASPLVIVLLVCVVVAAWVSWEQGRAS